MAGGLFGNPFVLNVKCIVFSLIVIALFLINPSVVLKNNYLLAVVLIGLFVIAYVSMAWYDYFYDCRLLPFKRGELSLTGKLKPEKHVSKEIECKKHGLSLYLAHIFVIVPLLVYIVYYNKKSTKMSFVLLGVLALFTLLYHGAELMSHRK
jgi:peptidoglycan/LPS O-acetylase OafA/YrhL